VIRRLHYCIPVVALSLGLALGMIEPVGALAVLLFAGWLVAQPHIPNSPWLFGTLLGALLLAAHLLPGFSPLPLGPPQDLGGASPWQLRISPDKAMVAAILLACWLGQPRTDWRSIRLTLLTSGACLILVPLLALASGVLGWQPKGPALFLPWLLINLGITCLAEELIFRGLLQRALVGRFGVVAGIGLATACSAPRTFRPASVSPGSPRWPVWATAWPSITPVTACGSRCFCTVRSTACICCC